MVFNARRAIISGYMLTHMLRTRPGRACWLGAGRGAVAGLPAAVLNHLRVAGWGCAMALAVCGLGLSLHASGQSLPPPKLETTPVLSSDHDALTTAQRALREEQTRVTAQPVGNISAAMMPSASNPGAPKTVFTTAVAVPGVEASSAPNAQPGLRAQLRAEASGLAQQLPGTERSSSGAVLADTVKAAVRPIADDVVNSPLARALRDVNETLRGNASNPSELSNAANQLSGRDSAGANTVGAQNRFAPAGFERGAALAESKRALEAESAALLLEELGLWGAGGLALLAVGAVARRVMVRMRRSGRQKNRARSRTRRGASVPHSHPPGETQLSDSDRRTMEGQSRRTSKSRISSHHKASPAGHATAANAASASVLGSPNPTRSDGHADPREPLPRASRSRRSSSSRR